MMKLLKLLLSINPLKVPYGYNGYEQLGKSASTSCITDKGDTKNNYAQFSTLELLRRFLQHLLTQEYYKFCFMGILATAKVYSKQKQAIAQFGKAILLNFKYKTNGIKEQKLPLPPSNILKL